MIYLTGDLHGDIRDKRIEFFKTLDENSTLIILGDAGIYFYPYKIEEWNNLNLKCLTIAIRGNHDSTFILHNMKEKTLFGAECYQLNDKTFIPKEGEILNINDKKFFVFGGALSIDKAWRTLGLDYWADEQPSQADFNNAIENLSRVNYNIDYFLAHDVYRDIAKKMFYMNEVINSSTSDMLAELEARIKINGGKPYEYFFGHWHRYGKFGDEIKYTCLYKEIYCLDTGGTKFFPDTYTYGEDNLCWKEL